MAKISKNERESPAGLQILTISAVKATSGGDWVLKKMVAPNDGGDTIFSMMLISDSDRIVQC